jgi:hypothetical protein
MRTIAFGIAASVLAIAVTVGCSGSKGGSITDDDGGTAVPWGDGTDSGPGTGTEGGTGTNDDAGMDPGKDSGTAKDSGAPPPDSGSVMSDDGFSASRTACINEINKLRATQSLAAYTLVNTDPVNSCIDAQATSDQAANSPHGAFIAAENNPTVCEGNAQNECLEGFGTTPTGIVQCLDSMWAEQYQSNCHGCVGCTQFGGNCPGCDYFGMQGMECGHYVNMSATYFSKVACGFSTAPNNASSGWSAQNFFP